MRARNIKPGLFENEILGQLDPIISLLFAGLSLLADREGRLEDRPLRIKAKLFPYREYPEIHRDLTTLEQHGFIQRYTVAKMSYIQIVNFKKHQSPHHTEKQSEIPAPVESPLEHGENPPDSLIHRFTDSDRPNGLSGDSPPENPAPPKKKKPPAPPPDPQLESDFEDFWRRWKPFEMTAGSKQTALKNYSKARKETDHATLVRAADAYCESCAATQCKTAHVASWLHQRRWGDDNAIPPTAPRPGRNGRATHADAFALAMADTTHTARLSPQRLAELGLPDVAGEP